MNGGNGHEVVIAPTPYEHTRRLEQAAAALLGLARPHRDDARLLHAMKTAWEALHEATICEVKQAEDQIKAKLIEARVAAEAVWAIVEPLTRKPVVAPPDLHINDPRAAVRELVARLGGDARDGSPHS